MILAVAEGFEPSIAGLTIRCLTNLATPQKLNLAAAARLELAHPRLQDECSVSQLSYAAIWWTGRDSNPHKKFAGLLCCRLHHQPEDISDCQFLIADCVSRAGTHRLRKRVQSEIGNRKLKMSCWLWVESNHQPRAYETLALIPLELHSRFGFWKPAEEFQPVRYTRKVLDGESVSFYVTG